MSFGPSVRTYGICSGLTGEAYEAAFAMWEHLERHLDRIHLAGLDGGGSAEASARA